MSTLSRMLGLDRKAPAVDTSPEYQNALQYEMNPASAQTAINQYATSAMSSAMPSFLKQLQGVRENAIARGIDTGDLGTTNEGNLASAFQRNFTNMIGGQALDTYNQSRNRYLDLLTGKLDAEQAAENNYQQRRSGFWNGLIQGGAQLGAAALLA